MPAASAGDRASTSTTSTPLLALGTCTRPSQNNHEHSCVGVKRAPF